MQLFSGIGLNNAKGGINPHAVQHTVLLGVKIIWMPPFSAANHIDKLATAAKGFPKDANTPDAEPLSVLVGDLLKLGVSIADIQTMFGQNGAQMLGL